MELHSYKVGLPMQLLVYLLGDGMGRVREFVIPTFRDMRSQLARANGRCFIMSKLDSHQSRICANISYYSASLSLSLYENTHNMNICIATIYNVYIVVYIPDPKKNWIEIVIVILKQKSS